MYTLGTGKKKIAGGYRSDNSGQHRRTDAGRRGSLGEGLFHGKEDPNKKKNGPGIIAGSPADKADLEVGDEILEVNGKSLEDHTHTEVISHIHQLTAE
uniref:Uncharacterized protein n=1 Tax=Rhodnius prolixus TaxID=13249 RepID=T1HUC5_RHOPR